MTPTRSGPHLPRLFAFELAWAEAVYDAFFPEGTALVHGIRPMKPGAFLDDILAQISLEPAIGLRVTLWLIALAPLFVLRRFATITSLDLDERVVLLERLLASRVYAVRQLVAGFKAMGSLLYAQSPEIRKQMSTPRRDVVVEASSLVRVKASPTPEHEHAGHAA